MLLTSRKLLQRKLLDVESDLRGTLHNFALKVGVVSGGRYEARVRELVAGFSQLTAIAELLLSATDAAAGGACLSHRPYTQHERAHEMVTKSDNLSGILPLMPRGHAPISRAS
jgi:hypothetical protein